MSRDALATLIPRPSLINSCIFASERNNRIQKLQSAAPPAIVPKMHLLTGSTFCVVFDPTKLPMLARESTAATIPPWNTKLIVVVPCANSIGGVSGRSNISSCCSISPHRTVRADGRRVDLMNCRYIPLLLNVDFVILPTLRAAFPMCKRQVAKKNADMASAPAAPATRWRGLPLRARFAAE